MKKPARDVPFLPIEIWTEIFLRIPAEDLVKFKGVCRAWYEQLNSVPFAQSHVDRSESRHISGLVLEVDHDPTTDVFYFSNVTACGSVRSSWFQNKRLYSCHSRKLLPDYQRDKMTGSEKFHVLASCDGLILISYEEETHFELLVWNPVTGSCRRLPVLRPMDMECYMLDHLLLGYVWTMIRCPSLGQYKIFGIENFQYGSHRRGCVIFELRIGGGAGPEYCEWKEPEVPLSGRWSIKACTVKEGKLHWLAVAVTKLDNYHETKVLSVNLLTEEFSTSTSVRFSYTGLAHNYKYFASEGAFYRAEYNKDEVSLCALENFETMKWTKYWNIRCELWTGDYVTVLGDGKLLMGFDCCIGVLDTVSKEWGMIDLEEHSVLFSADNVVLHTNSIVRCD